MLCPVCQKPFIIVERNKIELDCCPHCQGFWFDADELASLAQAYQLKMNMPDFACLPLVQTSEKKYRCPRCSKGLDKVCLDEGSNLVIDRCPKGDGLWFDAGELSRSMQALVATNNDHPSEFINFLGEVFYVK